MATLKYPLQVANGGLLLSDDATAEAIISAIQTRYGERILRNTYGNDLDEFTNTNDLSRLLAELEEAIINSTLDYRPLSIFLEGSIGDFGTVSITVEYEDTERTGTITIKL